MLGLLIKWLISAGALYAAMRITERVSVGNIQTLLVAVGIIGIISLILGSLLKTITLPLTVITLGLSAVAISIAASTAGFILAAKLLPAFHVDSTKGALITAATYSAIRVVIGLFL